LQKFQESEPAALSDSFSLLSEDIPDNLNIFKILKLPHKKPPVSFQPDGLAALVSS
jgi:hypothetical protein